MRCYSQRGTRCQTSTDSPSGDASSTRRKALSAATDSREEEEAETPSHSAPGAVRVRAAAERAEVVAWEGEHPVVGA